MEYFCSPLVDVYKCFWYHSTMKLYISEEWTTPTYQVFKEKELSPENIAKCKEVEVESIDGTKIIHDRDRWMASEDKLAGLFRPGLVN